MISSMGGKMSKFDCFLCSCIKIYNSVCGWLQQAAEDNVMMYRDITFWSQTRFIYQKTNKTRTHDIRSFHFIRKNTFEYVIKNCFINNLLPKKLWYVCVHKYDAF